jgi:cystathionine beta-lyase/cystathionine gamma-synthase
VDSFLHHLEVIRLAPSLGGVTTTISYPAKTSQRALTEKERAEVGISDALLRLSVGIDDVDDIIADLDRGLGCL